MQKRCRLPLLRSHRSVARGALLIGLSLMAGCNIVKTIGILTGPKSEKVEAQFNRLADARVLVYVGIPPEIAWDYPKIRLDLAAYLSDYLRPNVPSATLVDPLLVERYLEKHRVPEVDPIQIGQHFRAEMVVHLEVYQFSMRDPGMAQFYRGRIGASVAVHDLSEPDQPPERFDLGEVVVAVPEEGQGRIGFANIQPDQLRQQTYQVFTVEVGKKFHAYERPIG